LAGFELGITEKKGRFQREMPFFGLRVWGLLGLEVGETDGVRPDFVSEVVDELLCASAPHFFVLPFWARQTIRESIMAKCFNGGN
jgi:hypothetical protein